MQVDLHLLTIMPAAKFFPRVLFPCRVSRYYHARSRNLDGWIGPRHFPMLPNGNLLLVYGVRLYGSHPLYIHRLRLPSGLVTIYRDGKINLLLCFLSLVPADKVLVQCSRYNPVLALA